MKVSLGLRKRSSKSLILSLFNFLYKSEKVSKLFKELIEINK